MTTAMTETRTSLLADYETAIVLDVAGRSADPVARAEAAERRLSFLSEVSTVLGSSLDYETTLADLARLAVPFLADWCIVYFVGDGPSVRRVVVTHASPDNAGLAEELQTFLVPDHNGSHPTIEAVRNGRPVMVPVLTDEILQVVARNADHLDVLRRMRLRSSICTPLIVQGRIVGSLLFLTAESGRVFGPDDLRLAQDLAGRAALAVENARLYREAQEARRTVEELNARLQRSMVETHHRVKNNLQIMAAMIDVRLMDDQETVTKKDLDGLASCVRALSSVHDTLTHQAREYGETEQVFVREVLGRLLPLIEQTSPDRAFEVIVADARLGVRQGTSLALVANELVSNAVKHGRRKVGVTLRVEDAAGTLTVTDDGPGFPPDFDAACAANTGLALVDTLSRWDLAGSVHFANGPKGGAVVTVRFPLNS